MSTLQEKHTRIIKTEALRLGFSFCGISKARRLDEHESLLEKWLKNGYHGKMGYMENYFEERLDPRKLVPGARSVISLLLNYYPEKQEGNSDYKISKYAYGRDYHKVLKKRLKALYNFILEEIGEVNGRAFVDSAPVMDKVWAKHSGLGWIGKNSNLITKSQGSFFFIAELITDLELVADEPITDFCGRCNRCVEACPTEAIVNPYIVDGSKCISYFTIELKDKIPVEYKGKFDNWIFGCDICQDVCPWNRFSKSNAEADFKPFPAVSGFKKVDWEEITEDIFNIVFSGSPLRRAKFEGLKRNIENSRTI